MPGHLLAAEGDLRGHECGQAGFFRRSEPAASIREEAPEPAKSDGEEAPRQSSPTHLPVDPIRNPSLGSSVGAPVAPDGAVFKPQGVEEAAGRRLPRHSAEQLVRGVGSIVACMAAKAPADYQLTCFHSSYAPKITIQNYIARILKNFQCSRVCLILALVYIDRLAKANTTIVVSELSCHRLFITAATLAAKFHDDLVFSNAHYAKAGGLSSRELSGLEKRFLYFLGWRLHVHPEEFEVYSDLVSHALAGMGKQVK